VSRSSLAAAGGFAALAVLVAAGTLTSVDQWAIDHAMPAATFTGRQPTTLQALIPLWHVRWHGALHIAAELVTLPASFLPATVVFGLSLRSLRGRRAFAWGAVYVFANAAEELTKSTLARPRLYRGQLPLAAFDSSYPSGHTIRTILLAAVVSAAWPRLRLATATWAACAIAGLEVGGFHVPTDLAGGALLSTALLLGLRRRL
jgi:membrane-associated phospholipid phosphatase